MSNRKVVFYKQYFQDFFNELDDKTKKKVLQVLVWIQTLDIILFNGFQKKTQKTPPGEIDRAKRLMIEYFETKEDN